MKERDLQQEAEHLQDHWSNTKEYNVSGYEGFKTDRRVELAKKIVEINPKSVLEIGCLGGYNLREIHKLAPEIELTGFDINKSALEYAKSKLPGLTTIHGSIYELDEVLREKQFDVIFTAGVFIHIPSWDKLTSQSSSELIQKIVDSIIRHSNIAVFHAEEHGEEFKKKTGKGMRYIQNFNVLYEGKGNVEIEDAPNPSHGFEHIVKVIL